MVEKKKPRLGFFKYSCCAGCEFQLIYFQKYVAEVLQFFDFIYCKLLSSGGTPEGPFDIALVEENLKNLVQKFIHEKNQEISLKCEMLVRAYDPCFSCSVH